MECIYATMLMHDDHDQGFNCFLTSRMLQSSCVQVYMCATILICVLCQKGPHAYMCILYLLDALVGYLDSLRNSQS